jgi:hypothetical protein
MTSVELASATPAGATLGQTSTHLPQRVQASSISSTRASSAVSNEISLIGCAYPALSPRSNQLRKARDARRNLTHKRRDVNGKAAPGPFSEGQFQVKKAKYS